MTSLARRFKAEPMLKEALAIREAVFGPSHASLVDVLESSAALLHETNRETDAKAVEDRIKSIQSGIARRTLENAQR